MGSIWTFDHRSTSYARAVTLLQLLADKAGMCFGRVGFLDRSSWHFGSLLMHEARYDAGS